MSEREKIREQLSAFLDGELSDAEAGRVESALARDTELARELAELRATRELLRVLPRRQLGADFAGKVLQAASARAVRRKVSTPWTHWVAAAALVVASIGAGLWISRKMPHPPEETQLAIRDSDYGAVATDLEIHRKRGTAERLKYKSSREDVAGYAEKPAIRESVQDASKEVAFARKGPSRPYDVAAKPALTPAVPPPPEAKPMTEAPGGAGGMPVEGLARADRPVLQQVIFTDDLQAGQKQVEAVLTANSIEVAPPSQKVLRLNQAVNVSVATRGEREGREVVANKIEDKGGRKTADEVQVEYLVYGEPRQLQRVQQELEKNVRPVQKVSQLPDQDYMRVMNEEIRGETKEESAKSDAFAKGRDVIAPAESEVSQTKAEAKPHAGELHGDEPRSQMRIAAASEPTPQPERFSFTQTQPQSGAWAANMPSPSSQPTDGKQQMDMAQQAPPQAAETMVITLRYRNPGELNEQQKATIRLMEIQQAPTPAKTAGEAAK